MMNTNRLRSEYDIIFAGGGTAACIAAGRLTEADPSLSILLVEQGENNLDNVSVVTPNKATGHIVPGSKTVLHYSSHEEAPALGNRIVNIQTGGILGGGSSVNFLMYIRGSAIDYDSWKTEGWDSKTLIRLAIKAENYQLGEASVDHSVHGQQGPLNVSYGTHTRTINYDDMFAAAEAVGIPPVPDLHNFTTGHGFSLAAKWIGPDGKRQDAAHRYIHPLMKSGQGPNLDILVNSTVARVRFQGTRAVGIEYEPTEPAEEAATPSFIAANKLVVVSAGALGTPQILERSGIGRAELLRDLGIDVVSDLPGVGENYQDHNMVACSYRANISDNESLDAIVDECEDPTSALSHESSKLAWNGIDVAAKMRPTEEEVAQLGPEFQCCWDRDFKDHPSRPVMLFTMLNLLWQASRGVQPPKDEAAEEQQQPRYLSLCTYTAYPYARGRIHIASRDRRVPGSFMSGFLEDPVDVMKQLWAYKKQRELMRRTDRYLGEYAPNHPAFRPGSKAACRDGPAAIFKSQEDRAALPPIEYDAEDDKAIEEYIRERVASTWHSLGTCKMAPREEGGVVDKYLNVHGTTGLKCCDLSIVPENVGANTYSTAIMVGEKAAEIMAAELGLGV